MAAVCMGVPISTSRFSPYSLPLATSAVNIRTFVLFRVQLMRHLLYLPIVHLIKHTFDDDDDSNQRRPAIERRQ